MQMKKYIIVFIILTGAYITKGQKKEDGNLNNQIIMKKIIHKADSRGHADHGWLNARHTFSFANYYDKTREHYGVLRVLNDDIIEGGMGFGMHPHANMEIITIPLMGSIEHKDNIGSHGVINVNDVQIMSAGTGVRHSEYNHSKTDTLNLLQIWVFPKLENIKPRYDQKTYDPSERKNKLQLVISPDKNDSTLWINQDAYFSLGNLEAGTEISYDSKLKGNGIYLFVIEGEIEIEGEKLQRRDAVGIYDFDHTKIKASKDSQILVMDLPMELQ